MEQEQDVFTPPTRCDACSSPRIRLTTNRVVHGAKAHNPDAQLYHCLKCGATANVVSGTTRPQGRMADSYLTSMRTRTHLMFDPLWQLGKLSRSKAYKLLAEAMGMTEAECHIGTMNKEQLTQAIGFCRRYLDEQVAVNRKREAKKYERRIKREERNASLEKYKRSAKRRV